MSVTQSIRNVVLVGSNGNGKTTLAEAMLHRAGVIDRPGRVDDGSTVCDYDPVEKERQQSLSLATASFAYGDRKINLIDTPGYADFVSEALGGMDAADLALFVIDAAAGVKARDAVLWRRAGQAGLVRMVFVNGLDRENTSYDQTLADVQDRFGPGAEPVTRPVGAESDLSGVVDLLADEDEDGHEQLVEIAVETDDELLEQYLEGTEPTAEQLEGLVRSAVAAGALVPVLCGSAVTGVGVEQLLDFIARAAPAPGETGPARVTAGGEPVEIAPDPDGRPAVFVFKTKIDEFLGQISYLKVVSGTLRANDTLVNSRTGDKERLHHLVSLTGAAHTPMDAAAAGDIAAVTKLDDTRTGDTLSDDDSLTVAVTPPPDPVYGVAIKAAAPAQEDKLATALRKLSTEDPSLTVRHEPATRQTVLSGGGAAHIRMAQARLERQGIDYVTEPVRVAYLETLAARADVESKFKKQSGGHGQFAVAMVRFEPLGRGAGYEFDSEVTGGAIPRGLIPAVGAGVAEAMGNGGRYGFPMVDLRAVCYDGKHHSVDSSEMSFKIAGSLALKSALEQAGSTVLEPVSDIRVEVPDNHQGDVLGDLSSRRGQVLGTEPGEILGTSVIRAHVPTSEILDYVMDLRSMTGGTGTFTAVHHDYQPLPSALLSRVTASDDD